MMNAFVFCAAFSSTAAPGATATAPFKTPLEKRVERATSPSLAATCRQEARRAGSPLQQAGCFFHPESTAQTSTEPAPVGDYLVLLHGLGRTSASMKPIEWHLKPLGYQVINFSYASRGDSIERLADYHLHAVLSSSLTNPAARVHFVTHSLGGILLRQYLSNHTLPNLGRVVMLVPPNQGSEVADFLRRHWLGRWLLGPNGRRLGTAATDLPKRLGPARFELGVIAGNRSLDPFSSWIIPGPDDGKVSVANTQLEGMKDFVVVPYSHTWLMWRRQTLRQIRQFLANGQFERP